MCILPLTLPLNTDNIPKGYWLNKHLKKYYFVHCSHIPDHSAVIVLGARLTLCRCQTTPTVGPHSLVLDMKHFPTFSTACFRMSLFYSAAGILIHQPRVEGLNSKL